MMTVGELIAKLDEEIQLAIRENDAELLASLHAGRRTLVAILERNGETPEYHLSSLDTRG